MLDTNIIVSGLNFDGPERMILDWARDGRFDLCLSPHILHETRTVLQRKFAWDKDQVANAMRLLTLSSIVVEPVTQVSRIPGHEADNFVLACAIEAHADYLVTGDRKHMLPLGEFQGTEIVSSAVFRRNLTDTESPGESV